MSNDPSLLPKPPKGAGLSRRLLFAVIGFGVVFIVVFLFFMQHYAPKSIKTALRENKAPMDRSASEALISDIKARQQGPLITATLKEPDAVSQTTSTSEVALSDSDFRAASNASISVYHAPMTPTRYDNRAVEENNMAPDSSNVNAIQPPNLNAYQNQNGQSEKQRFLQSADQHQKNVIASRLEKQTSPYVIKAGSIIPATLVTGIHSDLPGTIIARVRRDVFDTVSGNDLLIPQGTTLLGQYDSQVTYGQSRVLIVWSRLIFPDGSSLDLEGMPGADLSGMAGLHDQVNHHYFKTFGSAMLFSLFGAAGQLSQPRNADEESQIQQTLSAAMGQQLSQTAMRLVEKNLNIQPTIQIRPGANFNVLLTRDMRLPHPYAL